MAIKKNEKIQFSTIQIGVIVKDMDKAIAYFEALGIGPFKSLHVTPKDRVTYGKLAPDVKNKAASAMLGPVEFELIQPVSGDSPPMRYLKAKGEGISHIGFHVGDLKKETEGIAHKGFNIISSGKYVEVPDGGFVFFDTDQIGGVQFELMKQQK